LAIELNEGRHTLMAEWRISFIDDGAQVLRRNSAACKQRDDSKRYFSIRQAAHVAQVIFTQLRPDHRDVQTAIIGQACQQDVFKFKRCGGAARGDIFHVDPGQPD